MWGGSIICIVKTFLDAAAFGIVSPTVEHKYPKLSYKNQLINILDFLKAKGQSQRYYIDKTNIYDEKKKQLPTNFLLLKFKI